MNHHEPELESLFGGDEASERELIIKLVGVGGAGSNAVDRLKMENPERVRLATINTDGQALASSPVEEKILIGISVTRGIGAGGDPELGRLAAETEKDRLAESLRGTDLVFLVAGMGGGTGSGAAPVVAEVASQEGALVIGFVTMPFSFEGGRRLKQADEGLVALRQVCDAVIPLPNDVLLQQVDDDASVLDAFGRADQWVDRAIKSIWSMLFKTGLINLDFASLKTAFAEKGGKTLFGLGYGEGEGFVDQAIEDLLLCPLLHTPEFSRKADRLLVNIIGGPDLALTEVNMIMGAVTEKFGRNPHVVMGAVIDEGWKRKVEVCVIGTSDMSPGVRPSGTSRSGKGKKHRPSHAGVKPSDLAVNRSTAPAPKSVKTAAMALASQDEFPFREGENRGHFGPTDRNLFDGQDLDLPTFFRKGIRITS
ncbi:MAG: cell division protein FtsZ [Verrucomicrobia bacterium]|nr:MAG: cell division protein FtsZ [Verrucomicrobiota bacterium]